MIICQEPIAPTPAGSSRCLPAWRVATDGCLLCRGGEIKSGPLAAASTSAECLLPTASTGCLRAGDKCQPLPPCPVAGQGSRQLIGHGNAHPPQQGRPPRQSRCGSQYSWARHRPSIGSRAAAFTALNGPAIVSLTTRIPGFFFPLGFQPCGQLVDGSIAMLILLPSPSDSDFLAP
jgi:hypothetical protein